MATLADRIRQLRTNKGLSQGELADIINVKRNTVSTWERGTRKPDFAALDALSSFFEVSFEYLLGNTDDETKRAKPTQDELDRLALSNLADEAYDLFKTYCRLSVKSQEIIARTIYGAYKIDKEDETLNPYDPFIITVIPNDN